MSELKIIPLDKIIRNPEQPRKWFDPDKLQELAQSIREHGVIQPIEVEQGDNVYILHEGERRWLASQMAGTTTIPAIVVPSLNGNGPIERLLRTLVANIQRDDLNVVEEAHAYLRMVEEFGYTILDVAKKVGKHDSHIRNRLVLTRLDDEIQQLIAESRLYGDTSLARELLKIDNKEARIGLAKSLAAKKLTLRGCKAAAIRLRAALDSRKINTLPSLHLASRRANVSFDENNEPKNWSMLELLGQVPPWSQVSNAAVSTCRQCELLDIANEDVCGRCPAVVLLGDLVKQAVKHGA